MAEEAKRTGEVYKDGAGEWRWRLKASNGQVIATSGEGYIKKSHAHEMLAKLHPESKIVVMSGEVDA